MHKRLPLLSSFLAIALSGNVALGSDTSKRKFNICGSYLSTFVEVANSRPEASIDEIKSEALAMWQNRESREVQVIMNSWSPSNFTNPRNHSEKYIYFVHGILDENELEWRDVRNHHPKNSNEVERNRREYAERLKRILEDPVDAINNQVAISASVISSDRPETFANSGFILQSNIENIFATASSDMGGRPPLGHESVPVDTPKNILNATVNRYNEIALYGGISPHPKLQIMGLFIKTDETGKPTCSSQRLVDFQKLAADKNLRIVFLKDPNSANFNRSYRG